MVVRARFQGMFASHWSVQCSNNNNKRKASMKLADMLKGYEQRTAEEALSELERELNVRTKCFPRWVEDGRVTKVDARDRLSRLRLAFEMLAGFVMRTEALAESSNGDASKMCAEVAQTMRLKEKIPVDAPEPF